MRYALIENAIIRCDDITQYSVLDTSLLHKGKDFFEDCDYALLFRSIKSFLDREHGDHELVISTLFYMIPCFVRALQSYLGKSVIVIPLYELIGKDNLMEVYDHYTIETTNDQGNISFNIYQSDILSKIKNDVDMYKEAKDSGLETIITINNYLDNILCVEEPNEVGDYYRNYNTIIEIKKGFAVFSPYGALKFYDEISPGINDVESIGNLQYVEKSIQASFSIAFCSGNGYFDNSYQTWVLMEKNRGLSFSRTIGKYSRESLLTLPESVIEETKLQISSSSLCFSKYYLDIERDYFGQLHVNIQSLDDRAIYKILIF